MAIHFYRADRKHGYLSNFSRQPFSLRGRDWASVEHYFQAMKFEETDPEYGERVRIAKTPFQAKRLGNNRKRRARSDWDAVRVRFMREGMLAKFRQNPRLLSRLLKTGDEELVEHTSNDAFWGDGGDGRGRNMAGQLLMEVRGILRSQDDTEVEGPEGAPE